MDDVATAVERYSADPQITVSRCGHVATVTFSRPPLNFVDTSLVRALADTFDQLGSDPSCRAIVLASEGRTFCAGADFTGQLDAPGNLSAQAFYTEAMRLFDVSKPLIAAIHGAAVGAGVGLALVADMRVSCPQARFSVNFNRIGIHPGFGLTHTLPALIGTQQAALLLYTGRRIDGSRALDLGLVDQRASNDDVLASAQALAAEIAASAPLAVSSTRQVLRENLITSARAINRQELAIQEVQFQTSDFREGVRAMAERRLPVFFGR